MAQKPGKYKMSTFVDDVLQVLAAMPTEKRGFWFPLSACGGALSRVSFSSGTTGFTACGSKGNEFKRWFPDEQSTVMYSSERKAGQHYICVVNGEVKNVDEADLITAKLHSRMSRKERTEELEASGVPKWLDNVAVPKIKEAIEADEGHQEKRVAAKRKADGEAHAEKEAKRFHFFYMIQSVVNSIGPGTPTKEQVDQVYQVSAAGQAIEHSSEMPGCRGFPTSFPFRHTELQGISVAEGGSHAVPYVRSKECHGELSHLLCKPCRRSMETTMRYARRCWKAAEGLDILPANGDPTELLKNMVLDVLEKVGKMMEDNEGEERHETVG